METVTAMKAREGSLQFVTVAVFTRSITSSEPQRYF